MALSRDPLDELIEQLERSMPAAAETGWVCDMPPVAHIQFAIAEILYGFTPTPKERRYNDRVWEYYAKESKRWAEHSASKEQGAGAARTIDRTK